MKKRKSRIKTYDVTIAISHESYGGYDHNDGTETHRVKAINRDVAAKKGLRKAEEDSGGYSLRVKEVQNINDEDDWVLFG